MFELYSIKKQIKIKETCKDNLNEITRFFSAGVVTNGHELLFNIKILSLNVYIAIWESVCLVLSHINII